MHPGEAAFISFGTQQYGKRDRVTTFLKPDIFVSTPGSKRYLEIKPISGSGVTAGAAKMIANDILFGPAGYKPDIAWQPMSPILITSTGERIFVVNVGGLVFYQDVNLIAVDAIAVGAIATGKDLLPYLLYQSRLLRPALARAATLAVGAGISTWRGFINMLELQACLHC